MNVYSLIAATNSEIRLTLVSITVDNSSNAVEASNHRTASVIIYDLWSNGSFQQLSAFGVLMFTILILLVSIAQKISARYGIQERL